MPELTEQRRAEIIKAAEDRAHCLRFLNALGLQNQIVANVRYLLAKSALETASRAYEQAIAGLTVEEMEDLLEILQEGRPPS